MADQAQVSVISDTWRRSMCRGLQKLREDGQLCDTHIFAAGEVQFKAHAVVLSASSPYFRSLFSSVRQGFFTIRIENIMPSMFLNVLHFIYTGELRAESHDLEELANIARQLELQKLESMCIELQKQKLKEETEVLGDGDIQAIPHSEANLDSLTGNWTISNNREFTSPRGNSRTPTPMTPVSRTPTPKTGLSRTPTPRTAASSINVRIPTSNGTNQSTWNSGIVSPRQTNRTSLSSAENVSMVKKDNRNGVYSNASPNISQNNQSSFAGQTNLKNSQSQFGEKIRPFSCPICGRKYGSMKGVNWHLQAHHGVSSSSRKSNSSNDKKPQCKICGRYFPQLNYLHLHEKCHRADKKGYTSPLASIGYHRHQPDENGRYVCKVCGRSFLRSQALGSHMWCHLPQGRYGKRQLKKSQENNETIQENDTTPDNAEKSNEQNPIEYENELSEVIQEDALGGQRKSQGHVNPQQKQVRQESYEYASEGSSDIGRSKNLHWQNANTTTSGNNNEENNHNSEKSGSNARHVFDSFKIAPKSNHSLESDETSTTGHDLGGIEETSNERKKLFGCEYCGREFLYALSLREHRRLHTGEKPYTCKSCGKTFRWYSVFSRHNCELGGERSKMSGNDGENTCPEADDLSIKREPMDNDHFEESAKVHETDRVNRSVNNYNSDWNSKEHSKVRRDPPPAHFDKVNSSTDREQCLNGGNEKMSFDSRPFDATASSANACVSGSSENLPQPIPVGSGDKWSCPICGNVYKSLYFVKNHMRIVHGGMKRYSCPLCNKRFGYSNVLRDHMKLHEMQMPPPPPPPPPPAPSISSVSPRDWSGGSRSLHQTQPGWTSNSYNTVQHWSPNFMNQSQSWPNASSMPQVWPSNSVNHSQSSWANERVGPSHAWSGGGSLHQSSWLGEGNISVSAGIASSNNPVSRGVFECRACHESFESHTALVTHIEMRHKETNSERSYLVCGIDNCNEAFNTHDELRHHRQQVHGMLGRDKKSYPCTYCSRVLCSYGGWKLHEMIHRGEKPIKCKYCPYNARSSANMYSHIQSRHKGRGMLGFGKIS